MASLPDTPLTEEQYLRLERAAEFKSEYHAGEMFAMSGGSTLYSWLAANLIMRLGPQLPKGCRIFTSDLRIKIPQARVYTYPDASIICGKPETFEDDNALNPLMIVEVLSSTTEAYDRGKKFELYRQIPSFKEYLLIHQDRPHVEHYSKQDAGGWLLKEYSGEESFEIARLSATVSLTSLYEDAFTSGG